MDISELHPALGKSANEAAILPAARSNAIAPRPSRSEDRLAGRPQSRMRLHQMLEARRRDALGRSRSCRATRCMSPRTKKSSKSSTRRRRSSAMHARPAASTCSAASRTRTTRSTASTSCTPSCPTNRAGPRRVSLRSSRRSSRGGTAPEKMEEVRSALKSGGLEPYDCLSPPSDGCDRDARREIQAGRTGRVGRAADRIRSAVEGDDPRPPGSCATADLGRRIRCLSAEVASLSHSQAIKLPSFRTSSVRPRLARSWQDRLPSLCPRAIQRGPNGASESKLEYRDEVIRRLALADFDRTSADLVAAQAGHFLGGRDVRLLVMRIEVRRLAGVLYNAINWQP